ncbi:hypothetical protein GCM10027051_03160 [Niabella terrae]
MTTIQKKWLPLLTLTAFFACKSAPEADQAKTEESKEVATPEGASYHTDSTQVIHFIGTKPVGEHHGSFQITEGTFYVKNAAVVTGGKLTFDIGSLNITDVDTSGTTKLKGHLSSADFLDVQKHPTATFEITSIEDFVPDSTNKLVLNGATNTIRGNLTLKKVSKNVSFPAIIYVTADSLTAKANFNINRTDWGLIYGNDQSLGDKFIRPEVNINFEIKAVR